jgi:hypothetical protein
MILAAAIVITVLSVAFVFLIRPKDLPEVEPVSPTAHLDDRKAAIYENLRDLQFEFRVGKLSEADYQATKLSLQKELAAVMAEIDRIQGSQPKAMAAAAKSTPVAPAPAVATKCPHCGAEFPQPLKFCGECGKAMA